MVPCPVPRSALTAGSAALTQPAVRRQTSQGQFSFIPHQTPSWPSASFLQMWLCWDEDELQTPSICQPSVLTITHQIQTTKYVCTVFHKR